jgi:hypothetical protein
MHNWLEARKAESLFLIALLRLALAEFSETASSVGATQLRAAHILPIRRRLSSDQPRQKAGWRVFAASAGGLAAGPERSHGPAQWQRSHVTVRSVFVRANPSRGAPVPRIVEAATIVVPLTVIRRVGRAIPADHRLAAAAGGTCPIVRRNHAPVAVERADSAVAAPTTRTRNAGLCLMEMHRPGLDYLGGGGGQPLLGRRRRSVRSRYDKSRDQ